MRIRTLGIVALALALAFAAPALADEVTPGEVTTFQADTPAVASEVNDNFQALVDAINDNAQRIAALENATPSASVAGSTYYFADTEVGVAGNQAPDPTFGRIFIFGGEGTLVFNADGTGTLSSTENDGELDMAGAAPSTYTLNTFLNVPFSVPITWTQSGNEVSFSFTDDGDTDTITLQASEDGSVLVALNNDSENNFLDEFDVSMILAIRIPNPAP